MSETILEYILNRATTHSHLKFFQLVRNFCYDNHDKFLIYGYIGEDNEAGYKWLYKKEINKMTDKKNKVNQAALERAIKKMTPFLTALENQDWKKVNKEINKMSKSLKRDKSK